MKLSHLAAVIVLAAPVFAHADDDKAVWGYGSLSCAKYAALKGAFDKPELTVALSWTQGFLTSINLARIHDNKKPMPFTEPAAIEAYTKKYCTEHPLKYVFHAATALAQEQLAGL